MTWALISWALLQAFSVLVGRACRLRDEQIPTFP